MTALLFADVAKDASVQSVHVPTAIGNATERRRRRANQVAAEQSRNHMGDDGGGEPNDGSVDKGFIKANVVKVDKKLGLVMGFAIVCKLDGRDYFDLQGDHIPENAMLEAATDFMLHSRMAKEMHDGDAAGTVVFAFPLTTDIAKALDIETKNTGLLIAMKPTAEMLGKFADGTYTGFSIGGSRLKDEDA